MYNNKWHPDPLGPSPALPRISSQSSLLFNARIMKCINELTGRIFGFILLMSASSMVLLAQGPQNKVAAVPDAPGEVWFYVTVGLALIALCVVFYFWKTSRKSIEDIVIRDGSSTNYYNSSGYESDVDAEKELEWLRKANRSSSSTPKISSRSRTTSEPQKQNVAAERPLSPKEHDTKVFQDKMKMLQYAQLPINSFSELAPTRHFEMLLDSDAKALAEAMEQSNGEFERDERTREAAIKTLGAFRTSNSIEALTQVALYDLSATLRSKAITVLTDFDHESVFETVLLACADPTREVRAAAARGLFRLNFDRAGAWKRIIETDDEFRMKQAIRAATEAGIVVKSFDRLVHQDVKVAYEAFTLVALMIRSGETDEIFTALRDHKDERVKYALLHALKTIKDERSLASLDELVVDSNCSVEVLNRTQDVIMTLRGIAAHSLA